MITISKSIKSYKLIIFGLLILIGIVLHQTGYFKEQFFLEIAETHLDKWWFIPLLILVTTSLYAFALPGSVMYVVAGLLYKPFLATLIVVAGGVSGAVAAYYLSGFLSKGTRSRIQSSKAFSIIQKHSDFATLGAVRMLPGFPHSIINYGSGILKTPLFIFIITATTGFAAKGYLYATAIHQATRIDGDEGIGGLEMAIPLILLALLFLLSKILRKNLSKSDITLEK